MDHNALIFWEADEITGPYKMVHYLSDWGPMTYFPNIPAKFISEDGGTAWLVCAANYMPNEINPPQCRYALSMHEISFNIAGRTTPDPPSVGRNIAQAASLEVSSTGPGCRVESLTDGLGDEAGEWCAEGEKVGAWIKLSWDAPRTVHKIRIYVRPNLEDQVRGGNFVFSDRSEERLHAWLSNSAKIPGEIDFPEKIIDWVKFRVDTVSSTTQAIGLSEIEVYEITDLVDN